MPNQVRVQINTTQNPRIDITGTNNPNRKTIRTIGVGTSSPIEMADITDVDVSSLLDGGVLTYNSSTGYYVLQDLNISGGEF